jgi:hypothetical protein
MSDLPREYRYVYKLWLFAGHWKHNYHLVGRWGGLNFHITDFGEERLAAIPDRYSAGLECHYRQPPDYMRNDPPSHDCCWLLKAPCWHDGTSIYAQETLLPLFDGKDHVRMFVHLAKEADERFEGARILEEIAS